MDEINIKEDAPLKEVTVFLTKSNRKNKCVNKKKIKQILKIHYKDNQID